MLNRRALSTIFVAVLLGTQSTESATNPAPEMHTIIELRQRCLIGGEENKKWMPADKIGLALKGRHKFTLYTLDGRAKEITANIGEDPNCEDSWSVEPSSPAETGIAITSPDWNPLPRVPRAINVNDRTYVKIVSDILRGAGIKRPEVVITEGYKIDLDGDGTEEVVLVASRYKNGISELSGISRETAPGDYSLVLVRKIVGSRVRNIFIIKNVRLMANEGPLTRGYHLSAIADLNGDGLMEIVLYSAYFEGSASHIIEIKGAKWMAVLRCGCEH